MQGSNPLDQLHDIIPAAPIEWWPMAFGLWVLIFLSIGLIGFISMSAVRRWRRFAWRREALLEFAHIKSTLLDMQIDNAQRTLYNERLNQLLKRALASAQSDAQIKSLPPKDWCEALYQALGTLSQQQVNAICYSHYQSQASVIEPEALVAIQRFLKRLK